MEIMKSKHRDLRKKIVPVLYTVVLALFANFSEAKDIAGYNDIVTRYAQGLSDEEQMAFVNSMQNSVRNALEHILQSELSASRVERQHIFRQSKGKPTKLFEFNNQYTAIGFERIFNHRGVWLKVAYVLLFEIRGPQELKYIDTYLFWKGRNYFEEYKQTSFNDLCKKFPIIAQMGECNNSLAKKIVKSEKEKPSPSTLQKPVRAESDLAVKKVNELDSKLRSLTAAIEEKADKRHTHSAEDITSGIIPEAYIDNAITRDRELRRTRQQAVVPHENADNSDYVADLESRIEELENTVTALSELLAGVSRNQDSIVFSGVNIQIVNGTGTTGGKVNGNGNLIVGYNQPREGNRTTIRTGSHNIIIGDGHEYTSYGGFVAGLSNTISGSYSSVTGGLRNAANGDYSTVNGGHFKTAEGVYEVADAKPDQTEEKKKEKRGCFIGQLQ